MGLDARTARRTIAWLAVAAAALAVACSQDRGARVRVGVSALRISLPVFVAAERGVFARHGIDVELRVYETAQPMVEELVDGRIDAGGYAAYPIVMLASRGAERAPVVVTALVEDREHRLSYALARRGSGLRFPGDAAGRRIGILPTAAYHRWLEAVLRAGGVDPASVTIVPIAPGLQGQLLAEGSVDLLFTNDPAATAALAAGVAEIADDGPPCALYLAEPFAFGAFVLSGELAAERPEVAARLVAALDEAIAITRADPDGAVADMLALLPREQRALAPRFPRARYLTSGEVPDDAVAAELAAERALGILDFTPEVTEWSRSGR